MATVGALSYARRSRRRKESEGTRPLLGTGVGHSHLVHIEAEASSSATLVAAFAIVSMLVLTVV
jgi:hypothetical protein